MTFSKRKLDFQGNSSTPPNEKTLNYSLIASWTSDDVARWLKSIGFSKFVDKFTQKNSIDGLTLLLLTEEDLKEPPLSIDRLVDLKHLWYQIRLVQSQQNDFYSSLNISRTNFSTDDDRSFRRSEILDETAKTNNSSLSTSNLFESNGEQLFESSILEKRSRSVFKTTKGEKRKLLASFIYALISGIWTSFIMVVVHNRVPNVQKYPPLPDLFLDNIPHIPWAFAVSEYLIVFMGTVFLTILTFHKYWNIILRRFFALGGTIFFLRSITMLVTSLSVKVSLNILIQHDCFRLISQKKVPGHHLECTPLKYGTMQEILSRCVQIFFFQGLSIQGIRSCGDYMFSGHTVVLTLLNHCITEYTTADFYVLHLVSWFCNIFGMVLILAAHEHYTIDVFIAFFLTSRLFLYYHSLANNAVLFSHSDKRLSIWFPMFSYFEKNIQSMVPNVARAPWPISIFFSSDDENEEKKRK